ncbi:LPS export ABC transporter periplasmic protein LptC [Nibribacter ruber]|uniref:LPS export ABC transporter periplasmic protein LptC n=1 Tax=Nibribacter ruber TaxID=2698458 RepID=A0A6P1NYU6_9BACT|nr:LPS export ABC transporter periplasmic protein LptC [Nibribacter ruber]QHL88190.1 LPS export ABC transporter periplasmic protein LptC [Nibribacter ruber]
MKVYSVYIGVLLALAGASCSGSDDEAAKMVQYKGPEAVTKDLVTIYSDSAKTVLKMTSPLEQKMQNGDILYPKGLFITFYEEGKPSSMVSSKYGKYDQSKDQYFVRNNVVVKNIIKKEKLNTEELYWDKKKRIIFTDKFVRITSEKEVATGHGLTANEDFSDYQIKNFSGSFTLQQ